MSIFLILVTNSNQRIIEVVTFVVSKAHLAFGVDAFMVSKSHSSSGWYVHPPFIESKPIYHNVDYCSYWVEPKPAQDNTQINNFKSH